MTNFKELGFLLMANPDRNHCSHCGYELRDNTSGRCPECGLKLAR